MNSCVIIYVLDVCNQKARVTSFSLEVIEENSTH